MALTAPILNARDVLSGEQGMVYAILPDGRRMNMMHVKNIEASVSFEKEGIPILGKRGKGNRKNGETYEGSMTAYFLDSNFRLLAEEYKNSGKDFYFEIEVTMDDPNSDACIATSDGITGQVVTLLDVNLNGIDLFRLDADSSIIEEDMDFTFEDYRIESPFNELAGLF